MTAEQLERKRVRNREWMRGYYSRNRESILERQKNNPNYKAYNRQWKADNQDKVIAQRRKWGAENKEKHKEATRVWRLNNPDKVRAAQSQWARNNYAKHSEMLLEQKKEWRLKNPEKFKAIQQRARKKNRQKRNEYNQQWRRKNAEHSRDYHNTWKAVRNLESAHFKTLCRLRARVHKKLKTRKMNNTLELCGATIGVIMNHLENQFRDGMTWENQSPTGWHIDHIIPCASFDLTDPEQQKKCFHYTNLQPLWWWENLSKGKRIAA